MIPIKVGTPTYTKGYVCKAFKGRPSLGWDIGDIRFSVNHNEDVLLFWKAYHLYLVKESTTDLVDSLIDFNKTDDNWLDKSVSDKIIATTDDIILLMNKGLDRSADIYVPKLTTDFLRLFADNNGLDTVLVEKEYNSVSEKYDTIVDENNCALVIKDIEII